MTEWMTPVRESKKWEGAITNGMTHVRESQKGEGAMTKVMETGEGVA